MVEMIIDDFDDTGSCWLQYDVQLKIKTTFGWQLTESLSSSKFSDRVVPVHPTVWVIFLVGLCLIVLHESTARKPLLVKEGQANTGLVQTVFFNFWFLPFFYTSLIAPISLDFCASLGQSATMSGLLLASPVLGTTVGAVCGKFLASESNWNQAFARKVIFWFPVLASLAAALAAEVCASSHSNGKVAFWQVVGLIQILSAAITVPAIPLFVMQAKITPNSQKSSQMILVHSGKVVGMLVGPAVFPVISMLVKGNHDASPASLMGWSFVAMVTVAVFMQVYGCMALPSTLSDQEPTSDPTSPETSVEHLSVAQRERVVKNMVWYALERPFSIAAIEVATIMILEVSYGWSPELCGSAFAIIAGTSLGFLLLSMWLLSNNLVTESGIFFWSSLISLLAVGLLFSFSGAAGLLVADAVIYGMATVGAGLADGWASKAAIPNTHFSNESYRLQTQIAMNSSRLMSPIIARSLLDYAGRNTYATLQLFVVFLGTVTVYSTVKLVWDHESPK